MAGVTGAKELDAVLRMLPKAIRQEAMASALRVAANVIRKETKAQAPRQDAYSIRALTTVYNSKRGRRVRFAKIKYGFLADNIRVTTRKHKAGAVVATIHNGKAYWGMFLEFGTKHMAARPWLTPAFEAKQGETLEVLGKRLGANIEKTAAMLAGPRSKMTKAFRRRLGR